MTRTHGTTDRVEPVTNYQRFDDLSPREHNTLHVCVEDAKSAIRWVRAHAKELGIDPAKVIAAGGSAGGHLAAATALVPGFDSAGDDLSISAVPDAMVLYNPGTNPSLSGRNEVRSKEGKDITKAISPTLFIREKAPPALLFYGVTVHQNRCRRGV